MTVNFMSSKIWASGQNHLILPDHEESNLCVAKTTGLLIVLRTRETTFPKGTHWKYRKVYLLIAAKIKSITPIYGEQKAPIEQMALEQDELYELKLPCEASFILLQSLH